MRIAIFVIVCATATAHAESPAERAARAAKLFEEGRDFAKVARYADACDRFARSYELDPASGTAVNFADCQEHLGHLARAHELFEHAARTASDNRVRAQYARDRGDALLPRLATLELKLDAGDVGRSTVTIGGHAVATAEELQMRVDPGNVEIVVASPERRFATTAHAAAGATTVVTVPASGATPSHGNAPPLEFHKARGWVLGAYAAGGASVASLVVSGVFAVSASRFYKDAFARGQCVDTAAGDRCTPEGLATVATAHDRANVATATFVAGAVLAAAGVALYVMAPERAEVFPVLEVVPSATPTSAGVSISGRF